MGKATLAGAMILAALVLTPRCKAEDPTARPHAQMYTRPVPVNEVQDAAFWIHPTDPNRSLILCTNETKGLEVHDTEGYLLKLLEDATNPQYVDVIYGMDGKDYALVSCDEGVKAYFIDPEKRKLTDATAGVYIKAPDYARPLGLFSYHSKSSGKFYYFLTDGDGSVEQFELSTAKDGISGKLMRAFKTPDKSKGGVADEDRAVVYFSVDKQGIWQFPAEPGDKSDPKLIIKLNENGLLPNARGPVLFKIDNQHGYLLVTSQGAKGGHTCVKVYDREEPHRFLGTIDPSPEGLGPLDHSSGLEVTSAPFGEAFPHGVLAINDQVTPSGSEDFKLYSWDEIAKELGLQQSGLPSPRK